MWYVYLNKYNCLALHCLYSVDTSFMSCILLQVLEKVIEQCGAKPADRDKWTRVQRLRENSKHLFLYVIEDKNIARMLGTHTIDQIVKHILKQVSDDDANEI